MADSHSRNQTTGREGLPEGGGTESDPPERGGGGKSAAVRKIIILVGTGVLLIGGWFLANRLFLTPSPPSIPARSALPVPAVNPPAQAGSAKDAGPVAAAPAPPTAGETKTAPEAGSGKVTPSEAGREKQGKEVSPVKSSPGPMVEAKATVRAAQPAVSFSLQIGAMVVEENAEKLKRKLDESGFPSVIRKGNAFVTKQVVTVGEPAGRQEAEELSRRLNVDGFPSQLISGEGKYTPQVGAFFNLDDAIDLARELQKKNYRPKITAKPESTVVFQVRHGRFDSRAAAMTRGGDLKAKGFDFRVVRD